LGKRMTKSFKFYLKEEKSLHRWISLDIEKLILYQQIDSEPKQQAVKKKHLQEAVRVKKK
jgi:hypothetical protein